MDKPITIIIDEFKKKLADDMNGSNLPPFILETILKDLHQEVFMLSRRQLEEDKIRYKQSLESKPEENSESNK